MRRRGLQRRLRGSLGLWGVEFLFLVLMEGSHSFDIPGSLTNSIGCFRVYTAGLSDLMFVSCILIPFVFTEHFFL